MIYLLDTNICIYLMNGMHRDALRSHLKQHASHDIGISTITLSELAHGFTKSKKQKRNKEELSALLHTLSLHDYDPMAAWEYGAIRELLERKGKLIGQMDFLIAAHALALEATLVTNNMKEFERVPGLLIENWTV